MIKLLACILFTGGYNANQVSTADLMERMDRAIENGWQPSPQLEQAPLQVVRPYHATTGSYLSSI
jgi:hypothetical protein